MVTLIHKNKLSDNVVLRNRNCLSLLATIEILKCIRHMYDKDIVRTA